MTKMKLEATARAGFVAQMIRGGRMVKRKGQVLSFAPHVGQLCSVSSGVLAVGLLVGASLLGSGPAFAGTCSPLTPPDGSTVTCSGAANAGADTTQAITGTEMTIVATPGFGITTAAGNAITINSGSGFRFGLNFTDANESLITATAGTALLVQNAAGNSFITTNGVLDGSVSGLVLNQFSAGAVVIDSTGSIIGQGNDGIKISSDGEAENITINAVSVTGGANGIDVFNSAYGDTVIQSTGAITAGSNGYANVVLQANWVDASANGRNGTVLKTDGRTYLSSFELGQSLKLADRLAFEPQVQLIYSDTQFDAATDSNGIESRVGIESSLIGRAGFRLKTTKSEKYNAEGGLFSGYLKANLWHNLSGADIELFSADQAIGGFEPKKTWVDVGLGTTLTVAKNTEIYFDADVEFGLDKQNTAGRGNVGLRFNW